MHSSGEKFVIPPQAELAVKALAEIAAFRLTDHAAAARAFAYNLAPGREQDARLRNRRIVRDKAAIVVLRNTAHDYEHRFKTARHTGVPRPFEQPTVGAEQVKRSKKAWISPRLVSHASQQQAGIKFVLGAEPKRTAKVQHERAEPLDKRIVLDTPEQLAHGRSVAHNASLNALGEPWTARDAASPPAAVDAVFAGYVSRFVMVQS